MVLLVCALWTFLISAVKRENVYELMGANVLSFMTCGTPMYQMIKTTPDGDQPPSPPGPPIAPDLSYSAQTAAKLEDLLEESRGDVYLALGVCAC
eukprot:4909146-Prymnesium_polylepis.1